jgi:adenylate kinase
VNVVLLGPPGSGKGTQGDRLSERLGLDHIATGDLLRAEVTDQTEIGREAASYMQRGELVPDSLILELVVPRMLAAANDGGYLLDGFPRSVDQAERVRARAAEAGATPQAVLYLDVPREELMRRILERARLEDRADDNEETVANRLLVFDEETHPLIDYYQGRELLHHIDANRVEDEVTATIFDVLGVR